MSQNTNDNFEQRCRVRTVADLIAGEDDILNLRDVEFAHAREDAREIDEAVEREDEHEEMTKRLELIRQRRQVIVV